MFWDLLYRTCKHLLRVNNVHHIISWPIGARCQRIMNEFQSVNGFPGIIGAIDGCHIRIKKPQEHPNSYCNRKNYHSVLLQGVCDHSKVFLDVYAGEPGSMHDMRMFRKSDLYYRIINNEIEFPQDSHLIGDLAYKLSTTLMVGFKNLGGLTNAHQMNFNYKLSRCRVDIENAFGYLKGRFRRLKYMETIRLDLMSLLIVSSCILNNLCIFNNDLPESIVMDI
ncbi:putative nuclease HARBI1 [Photinus pyralis]|uniref:putative nuclease HARBI1 n=1 Tax=Photinus pyralis TaxID=7054 RepID=UPI001267482E|nr:putative nuclease HARBI1 [Photinus pyralis]